jgi:hypothetical protein
MKTQPRRRCLGLALSLGVALPAATAQSGWKSLIGEPVPALTADSWLNVDGEAPSLAALKGKVWLLEFFATT